ncbi:MAG: hypothetical protein WCK27_19680 [Verrucomicrobiota bacterium]
MAVIDELPGSLHRDRETQAPRYIVEPDFQEAEQRFAGLALVFGGLVEKAPELGFGHLRHEAGYLLFAQVLAVVGHFFHAAGAAGRELLVAAGFLFFIHDAIRGAFAALKEQLLADFPAFFAAGACISGHLLKSSSEI